LKAKQLTVEGLNFLIDAGDCALNGGVGSPYLFAIYGELSHADSLINRVTPESRDDSKCE